MAIIHEASANMLARNVFRVNAAARRCCAAATSVLVIISSMSSEGAHRGPAGEPSSGEFSGGAGYGFVRLRQRTGPFRRFQRVDEVAGGSRASTLCPPDSCQIAKPVLSKNSQV
jgi:hypothetical protein